MQSIFYRLLETGAFTALRYFFAVMLLLCAFNVRAEVELGLQDVKTRLSVAPKEIDPVTPLHARRKIVENEAHDRQLLEGENSLTFHIPLGVHVGTLGRGGFIGLSITSYFNTRFLVSQFDYSADADLDFGDSAVPGEIELNLDYQALLFDYHPFAGSFHITVGWVANDTSVAMKANVKAGDTFKFGDQVVAATADGQLYGSATPAKSHVPYFGIGFGNYADGSPLTFALDLGVVQQGTFDVSVGYSGFGVQEKSSLDQEVQNAQQELGGGDGLDMLERYPVLQMSLSYRFDI